MAIIKTDAPGMSEVLCGIRLRKAQNTFLNQIDKMVDWRPIRTFINKKYLKRANAAGHPAYDTYKKSRQTQKNTEKRRE